MTDAWKVAAIGVRFAAAYLVIQAAVGLVGALGLLRIDSGLGALGFVSMLAALVLGIVLWRAAGRIGRFFARDLD